MLWLDSRLRIRSSRSVRSSRRSGTGPDSHGLVTGTSLPQPSDTGPAKQRDRHRRHVGHTARVPPTSATDSGMRRRVEQVNLRSTAGLTVPRRRRRGRDGGCRLRRLAGRTTQRRHPRDGPVCVDATHRGDPRSPACTGDSGSSSRTGRRPGRRRRRGRAGTSAGPSRRTRGRRRHRRLGSRERPLRRSARGQVGRANPPPLPRRERTGLPAARDPRAVQRPQPTAAPPDPRDRLAGTERDVGRGRGPPRLHRAQRPVRRRRHDLRHRRLEQRSPPWGSSTSRWSSCTST